MQAPDRNTRYLISEDNGKTARMMWLTESTETHYTFGLSAELPYEDGTTWSRIQEKGMMIDHELWTHHAEYLPFTILKELVVNPYQIFGSDE